MNPKLVGNPLIAWREDSVLQIGWGTHSVLIDSAPEALPAWLRLGNGSRSRVSLLEAADRLGIARTLADSTLDRLISVGLVETHDQHGAVAVQARGLLEEPLSQALRRAGLAVEPDADVVVFAQGQLPSLVNAPQRVRRLIPLWFEARAVHVGPVLDKTCGPCSACIDRTWEQLDSAWTTLVAQAATVPTWHDPAQLVQAAGAIALIADDPTTVGLEMIFDPAKPGPMWRVWSVHDQCRCRVGQVPDQPRNLARSTPGRRETVRQQTTAGSRSTGTRR